MLRGREGELDAADRVLDRARAGRGSALCFEGEAGIGKTTLLAAVEAAAIGFRSVRAVGVESEVTLGHAGLRDVIAPFVESLGAIPEPQAHALRAAIGRSGGGAGQDRFLVAAATLSLLSAASQEQPVLVLLDDLQWVDRESRDALLFAARRLHEDAVAIVLARRIGGEDLRLADVIVHRVLGLPAPDAAELLRGRVSTHLVGRLVAETGGNPLALLEAGRTLSAEQRRGSAPLPPVLPVGARLSADFGNVLDTLSKDGRRAVVITAASRDGSGGVVDRALRAAGIDADAALVEAERAGAIRLELGSVSFRHPLIRSAVWDRAEPDERRSAHASLAEATRERPAERAQHRAEAVVGFDDSLAAELVQLAEVERSHGGFAVATALCERAVSLCSSPARAAVAAATAVEYALLSGDVGRVRVMASHVMAQPDVAADVLARVQLSLGTLEYSTGSVVRARALLNEAARLGSGLIRVWALAELAKVEYRLGSVLGVTRAAEALETAADLSSPEQDLLSTYIRAAALAFSGDWAGARPLALRVLELLETNERLRDDPRLLAITLLTVGWAGEIDLALPLVDRRMARARSLGAIGELPLALSVLAGGAAMLGRHHDAYAYAGEAVELGLELGYVVEVGTAYELLAIQLAARGRHTDAAHALAEARRLAEVAEVSAGAVQLHLADAICALCRGDLPRVVSVLERQLSADEGRLPRGDYPLSVAADLVEAYLGLDRGDEADAIAARHAALHAGSDRAYIRGNVLRIAGMVALDHDEADAAFTAAYAVHAGVDPFTAARTRLLHGERMRRAGRRLASRQLLTEAARAFDAMGLDAWTARANHELAATGAVVRRKPVPGDSLTSQETRVALLVARAKTNREIASALFLSPKTVERHVTSILRKRGLRSRTDLAASFARAD